MKYNRKYKYLIYTLLLLLLAAAVMSCGNRGPSGVTTAESDTETMDGGSISLTESSDTAEETTPTSPETETQAETKGEYTAEGIPSYFKADYLPSDMAFASQESLEILTDIYHEIGYFEEYEYESGDKTVYDYYRKKFALLLEGKVKMYDSKGNESLLYDRYPLMRGYEDNPGFELYFFDMDGDGLPELCVEGVWGIYICKYDADSDRYMEWWGGTNSGGRILGTGKLSYTHHDSGDQDYFGQLDENGNTVSTIAFERSYRPGKKYLVSVPDFEERVKDGEIPDSMKRQILHVQHPYAYYLRVTEEQFRGLIKRLNEARKAAEKERVPLSYFLDPEV